MTSFYKTLGLDKEVPMHDACKRIEVLKGFLKEERMKEFLETKMRADCSMQTKNRMLTKFTERGELFLSICRRLLTNPSTRWILNKLCKETLDLDERNKIFQVIGWYNKNSDDSMKLDIEDCLKTIPYGEVQPFAPPEAGLVAQRCLCPHCKFEMELSPKLKLISCECETRVVHKKCAEELFKTYGNKCHNCLKSITISDMISYRQLFSY